MRWRLQYEADYWNEYVQALVSGGRLGPGLIDAMTILETAL